MDERKHNNAFYYESIYGTGRTQPRKSHGGLISILLILVIFLAGLSVALSAINVKLVHQLRDQKPDQTKAIQFSQGPCSKTLEGEPYAMDLSPASVQISSLGITCEEMPASFQHYTEFPDGLLITDLEAGSEAEMQGIERWDILLSVGDVRTTDLASLEEVLCGIVPGQPTAVIICRAGNQLSLSLIVSE